VAYLGLWGEGACASLVCHQLQTETIGYVTAIHRRKLVKNCEKGEQSRQANGGAKGADGTGVIGGWGCIPSPVGVESGTKKKMFAYVPRNVDLPARLMRRRQLKLRPRRLRPMNVGGPCALHNRHNLLLRHWSASPWSQMGSR